MIHLPGYKINECLTENTFFLFYEAYSLTDHKKVIIKALKSVNPSDEEIASTIHDYHVTKSIFIEEVLSPLKIVNHLNKPFIITDYFHGMTLRDYVKNNKLSLLDFLHIAEKLAIALSKIHHQNIIHKNINPENILINKQASEIKIVGFNHSTLLKREEQLNKTPSEIDGILIYISPEQTGRLNRLLDFRSDLYSLGVTLYEMMTRKLPFQYEEPIELIHAHLVKTPVEPRILNDDLPLVVSNIMMKLLNKAPENRYNSALGLKEDVTTCLSRLYLFGTIEPFPLGEKDFSVLFDTGSKLYGREDHIKQIEMAFERVSRGSTELLLISGEGGIGKTVLVNEVHRPLVSGKGYLISGKFDQLQNSIPYAPVIQAFKSLIRQIITESDEKIKRWKQLIHEELGENISIIKTVIPELSWLLDEEVTQIEEVFSYSSQRRFLLYFRKFMMIFAKREHPLVLFLDDLQWADVATLDLIEYVLTYSGENSLLMIGAFRHNELDVSDCFGQMMKRLKTNRVKVSEIHLQRLQFHTIFHWIEDTLSINRAEAIELAQFMYRISQGNPFYMRQLFQSFYDDHYIYFDIATCKWLVHLHGIKNGFMNENIISFIISKVSLLPTETQDALKIASCIGNEFELGTLTHVLNQVFVKTSNELWPALECGLIIPNDRTYKWVHSLEEMNVIEEKLPAYRFLHDKVQRAVYSMMTDKEREQIHLLIGRFLVRRDAGIIDEQLFEIVNHFNYSRHHLNDDEQIQLAKWNMEAGEKAKESAAFKEALQLFQTAYELLNDAWDSYYELMYELMKELGELLYLNSQFDESEQVFNEIIEHAKTNYEKLIIYELKTTLYTHMNRVEEAVETGIEALSLFGMHFKRNPNKLVVAKELVLVKKALFRKKIANLIHLPVMEDEEQRLILQMLVTLVGSTILIDQNLATIFILKSLRYSLENGITDITSLVFSNYALILSAGFDHYEESDQFGRIALEIAERSNQFALKGRVHFIYGSFLNHWRHSLVNNVDYLEISQHYSFHSGDIHLAGAASSFIVITLFIKGEPLREVRRVVTEQFKMTKEVDFPISIGYLNEIEKWLCHLMDNSEEIEWKFEETVHDDASKIMHYTLRLMMAYLYDKKDYAKEVLQHLKKIVDNRYTLVIAPEYYFYESLLYLRFGSEDREEKLISIRKIKKNSKKLLRWAKFSPHNYLHKYMLVKAEISYLKGDEKAAISYYDSAITLAEKSGFIQDVAIANECAAKYFLKKKYMKLVSAHMTEAYEHYVKWGAKTKAEQLLINYGQFIRLTNTQTKYDLGLSFDINTALKATQMISKEIILEKLIKQLMETIMQYAGAEEGVLLFRRDKELKMIAKCYADQDITILQEVESFTEEEFSKKIVDYVQISKEPIVLDHAAQSGIFIDDPYVSQHQSKSIVCIPILNKGDVKGILYLENNKMTQAFTKEIIHLLTFISTQASISIENAYLYENLEEKVEERTAELEVLNKHLEELNNRLAQSEQIRSQLFSNISHDLRAPIGVVRGYIEAILDGAAETEQLKESFLQKSIKQLENLNGMINDLFELARLESGQSHFTFDIVPIDKLLRHVKDQFEHDMLKEGLRFDLNLRENNEHSYPMVEVDIRKMMQLFANILTNAKKHTRLGGIKISIKEINDTHIEVHIIDSGIGIAAKYLPFIFDRNFTVATEVSERGNGLGLAICKEIITLHNGEIRAESVQGEGTTIIITLPVYDVAESELEFV